MNLLMYFCIYIEDDLVAEVVAYFQPEPVVDDLGQVKIRIFTHFGLGWINLSWFYIAGTRT